MKNNYTQHSKASFWRQLGQDFAFEGVDETSLSNRTAQWLNYVEALLGPAPSSQTRRRPDPDCAASRDTAPGEHENSPSTYLLSETGAAHPGD